MAKRKDSKNRALKKGEGVRKRNGKESYYYRWSDESGKRHYIYSANLNELRRKETQIVRDRMDGINYVGNLTLNDVYYMWIKVKKGLRDITFSRYQYLYETYVFKTIGKKKIINLTKLDIRLFYTELMEEKNLNIRTIKNIQKVVHQVFDIAVEQNYIRSNISSGVLKELVKTGENSEKKKALTKEQQNLFEECLLDQKDIYFRPIFLVMLYTGLRVGEATGLRWCDIDFDKKEISVNHNLVYYGMRNPKKYTYAINKPKTRSSYRKVPMANVVYESLKQLKQFQEDTHLTCNQTIDGYYDFVFINQFGNVYEKSRLNRILDRIVKDCNLKQIEKIENDGVKDVVMLPHISCHILRHTAATRLFESGVSARFVMDILGHSDIQTTMNIYVDVTEEHKNDEFLKYQAYMENMKC